MTQYNEDEDEFDFKEILQLLGKHKIKLFIVTLFFTLLAAIYAYLEPDIYQATTSIEIKKVKTEISAKEILNKAMSSENVNENTEVKILKSRSLIARAIRYIDFTHKYYVKYRLKKYELYKASPFEVDLDKGLGLTFYIYPLNKTSYKLKVEGTDKDSKESWKIEKEYLYGVHVKEKYFEYTLKLKEESTLNKDAVYQFIVLDKIKAIQEIQKNLVVNTTKAESSIYDISYKDSLSIRAYEFTNALANTYLQQGIEEKTKEASNILSFIDEQLARINIKLQKSEENFETFKNTSSMKNIGRKTKDIFDKVSNYENKLEELKIKEEMLNSLYKHIQEENNFEDISTVGLNLGSTNLPMLIQKLQEAQIKRNILLSEYTSAHSAVKKQLKNISQLKKVISTTIKTLKKRVSMKKVLLEKTINNYSESIETLSKKEKIYGKLNRDFIVNEKIYSYLLEKRATTAIAKASTVNTSRIIDTAIIPDKPIKPNRLVIVLIGFLAGLILGMVWVLLKEFMSNYIKDEAYIRKHSKLTFFRTIPYIKNETKGIKVFESPKSSFAESFRSLRSDLHFIIKKENCLLITVTSTIGGEGKTTIATNLAASISLTGKKTIILYMDMRKQTVHKMFNLPNTEGMSTLLSGNSSLDDVIQKSEYENFDMIFAGKIPPNPSEMIESEKMDEVIYELKKRYDYVIFDTPPIGIVSDATMLMQKSDISFYILRVNVSKKEYLENVKRMIELHNIKNFGLLFNGLKIDNNTYGYCEE